MIYIKKYNCFHSSYFNVEMNAVIYFLFAKFGNCINKMLNCFANGNNGKYV